MFVWYRKNARIFNAKCFAPTLTKIALRTKLVNKSSKILTIEGGGEKQDQILKLDLTNEVILDSDRQNHRCSSYKMIYHANFWQSPRFFSRSLFL